MKKIYQIGFIAMLVALLPTDLVFAGDGYGKDTKNTIAVKNGASSKTITLMVNTTGLIVTDDILVTTTTPGAYIRDISPVVNGFEIAIDLDPDLVNSVGIDNGDVIIEIVGVDNITGVDASDGNTGTSYNTNIVITDLGDNFTGNNGNGTEMHGNPNSNGTVFNPVTSTSKNDVTIYPNPVVDQTNVVTVGEILGKKIEIMDLSGHVVMNIIVPQNSRQTVIDLSQLTPGLYILNFEMEDGQVISKRIQKI